MVPAHHVNGPIDRSVWFVRFALVAWLASIASVALAVLDCASDFDSAFDSTFDLTFDSAFDSAFDSDIVVGVVMHIVTIAAVVMLCDSHVRRHQLVDFLNYNFGIVRTGSLAYECYIVIASFVVVVAVHIAFAIQAHHRKVIAFASYLNIIYLIAFAVHCLPYNYYYY